MADPAEPEREGIPDGRQAGADEGAASDPDEEPPGADEGTAPDTDERPAGADERERGPGDAAGDHDDPTLSGWWRYPPVAWLGLVLAPPIVAVGAPVVAAVDDIVVMQALFLALVVALVVPGLALALGSLLSFGTVFWGSMRYEDDDAVDWSPTPWLYLVAAVVFTPLLVGGVWFVQRARYVGVPEFGEWI